MVLKILYSEKRITNANSVFVSNLIKHVLPQNIYDSLDIPQKIEKIRQGARECHKHQENPYLGCDIRSAFALIQHCRSWSTMQFLMQKGLLTIQNDLNIPFTWSDTNEQLLSIGGTVGYYLSQQPQPLELMVLFTVILYRQLSNNLTFLTTQANIAIFQYAVEALI